MASLADLRDAVFPTAVRLGPLPPGSVPAPADEATTVSWVRTMRSRVPAFDALEAADLVVAPVEALALVAPDAASAAALVDALVAARVAGVLVVGDPAVGRHVLDELIPAGIAVYALAAGEPGTIERSAIAFLVNRGAELERLAALLERRLEGLALAGRELEALVAEIAASLGRAVALEDRRGEPIAVHAPPNAEPAAVARYVGGGTVTGLRVPLPSAGGPAGGGAIALLGERPPTELERLAIDRAAALLSLALTRDDAVRSARDASRRTDALPSAGPPWIVVVTRQADDPREARESLRREVRLLAPARRLALRGDADSLDLRAVVAGDADDPVGELLAARIASTVQRPVASSRPFDRPAHRAAAEAEARTTLEAWHALAESRRGGGEPAPGRGPGKPAAAKPTAAKPTAGAPIVLRADRLPAYRLLGGLHNVPDGRRQAEALLAPLRVGSQRAIDDRLRTLGSVLREAGATEAAAALGIHRNTLAYRVRAIESLTGWRLADPDLRLPLLVALELVHPEQD